MWPTSATRWLPPIPRAPEIYRDNADHYLAKLDVLDRDVRAAVEQIPEGHRKVISTHDAFGYFAAAYGIEFIAPQGVSTESEASARDIAAIITQIKASKIPAVFLENISDPRLIAPDLDRDRGQDRRDAVFRQPDG